MYKPDDLVAQIIEPTLASLELDGDTCVQATEQLLGTAAHESRLGRFRVQQGGGPALGIWQVEPATHDDLFENFLRYRPALRARVILCREITANPLQQLRDNDRYACAIARLVYYRSPAALPPAGDLEAQARYWGKWYQTTNDEKKIQQYISDWQELVAAA